VFNATFSNISAISWRSGLLVEDKVLIAMCQLNWRRKGIQMYFHNNNKFKGIIYQKRISSMTTISHTCYCLPFNKIFITICLKYIQLNWMCKGILHFIRFHLGGILKVISRDHLYINNMFSFQVFDIMLMLYDTDIEFSRWPEGCGLSCNCVILSTIKRGQIHFNVFSFSSVERQKEMVITYALTSQRTPLNIIISTLVSAIFRQFDTCFGLFDIAG
jgi:hypothetical protein